VIQPVAQELADSRVTIHMAASLDGFIARTDGTVDWMETSDEFAAGETMDPEFVEAFLKTIDCYVMGSRTYETALNFEAKGFGWSYGDKPTFVLTSRDLPKTKEKEELKDVEIDVGGLLPEDRHYYSFSGSLTTPPCTENVRWFVLKQAVTVSPTEVERFSRIYRNDARPTQPLHDRVVLESR